MKSNERAVIAMELTQTLKDRKIGEADIQMIFSNAYNTARMLRNAKLKEMRMADAANKDA